MKKITNEKEVRNNIRSVRLSDIEEKDLIKNANEQGITVNEYILTKCKSKSLTPEMCVRLTNDLMIAVKLCEKYGEVSLMNFFEKEIDELW